jgi:hypothetical protein
LVEAVERVELMNEEEAQKEVDERNAISEAYIRQHYGDSIGPRRRYHWEVRGGEPCLVED